ncbi:MAG: hypothetical protein ACTSRS_12515 [Candidatus Helarchaeota archaeon]
MEDRDLIKDEIKERQRRYQLKKELHKELEARLAAERKKWEKHFMVDVSNSVFLILRDEKGDKKDFILISMRKSNGVLGKAMKIEMGYIMKLAKKKNLNFYPWIYQINFGSAPFFPYTSEQEYVTSSPTFLLVKNRGYVEDLIDPYNVKLAGFLFVNYPKYGTFLEGVSGSVVGNIAVIEKIMKRNQEPYSRENHLLNWLYFFLSKDSEARKISFQIFSMHEQWTDSFSKYLKKIKTSFR